MASRAVWTGAISFGLVHVPVSLHSASHDESIDFDWLDKKTLDPVGYKRVNKRTGKEIDRDDIVKGVKTDDGKYVVLSDEEIRAAYPKKTQTIDIQSFCPAQDVSFVYIEKPYYLQPEQGASKVYALLRDAMAGPSLIGLATMVMHNKEHLAALLPAGPSLMIGTLRWADEIRSPEGLDLPSAGKSANGIKESELTMAEQLIDGMTAPFRPQDYHDTFAEAIRTLVERKAKAGKAQSIEPLEEAPAWQTNVVDLTALLRQSLAQKKAGTSDKGKASKSGAARKHG